MKKLGIIGGAGPLASALLYQSLVKECYAQNLPLFEMVLLNVPFTRGLSLEEGSTHQRRIEQELRGAVESLMKNGVTLGALACNTLHAYLKSPPIPFISLPQATLEEAKSMGSKRLLIFGTENTRHQQLYKNQLFPGRAEQQVVNEVIDNILEGIVCERDSIRLSKAISTLSSQVDGVVLGCTDLSVLHDAYPISSSIPIYDSIKITAKKLLRSLP